MTATTAAQTIAVRTDLAWHGPDPALGIEP